MRESVLDLAKAVREGAKQAGTGGKAGGEAGAAQSGSARSRDSTVNLLSPTDCAKHRRNRRGAAPLPRTPPSSRQSGTCSRPSACPT